jgi:hypothetical protein
MQTGPNMEESVYKWWARSLKRFLKEHPDEVYFGLAAVCNPFDPGFFLCLGCEKPIHTTLRRNPHRTEQEQRASPQEWCYESFDYDGNTRDRFDAHFSWLKDFCQELHDSDKPRTREMFETFVEALMRAMIRLEREFIDGSPRFSRPTDVFVVFEDDELNQARKRYRALKKNGRLKAGWSKVIAGMKG